MVRRKPSHVRFSSLGLICRTRYYLNNILGPAMKTSHVEVFTKYTGEKSLFLTLSVAVVGSYLVLPFLKLINIIILKFSIPPRCIKSNKPLPLCGIINKPFIINKKLKLKIVKNKLCW